MIVFGGMSILELRLVDFTAFRAARMTLASGINVLLGANAHTEVGYGENNRG